MTLEEFQRNKKLVSSAADLHNANDTFKRMLEVLANSSPLRTPLPPKGNTQQDHSYRLGLVEGYHMALKTLEATWTLPSPPPKQLVSSFQEEP